VFRVLGRAHAARGAIRFTPADGSRGTRAIVALVSIDGQPRTRQVVTRYSAPSPARPGRVHRLQITQQRGTFAVSFRAARGASRYLVRIDASDGRHLQELIPARRRSVQIPALGYADHIRVTVTGISATGRTGPTTSHKSTTS
jgi:hypothetical protein